MLSRDGRYFRQRHQQRNPETHCARESGILWASLTAEIKKSSIYRDISIYREIYRTLIHPVVLYGHESWTIRAEDANALGVFERRILRTIFGGVFEHGAWRRRINHELAELYGGPSILTVANGSPAIPSSAEGAGEHSEHDA